MPGKPLIVILCLALAALPACTAMAGEGNAAFSYRRFYELLYQFRSLPEEQTNQLEFAIRLRNSERELPRNLSAWIPYQARRIEVPIDRFGMLDLPFSPQLANVNATLVTNQPAGSLEFGLAMLIRPPEGNTIDVEWLVSGMQQADHAMQATARPDAGRIPEAVGVTLKFAGDTQGRVIITGESGEVDYRADDYNTVDIPLDPDNLPDSITVTEQPLVIFPLFMD